jgi:hypothetical protein
MDSYKKFYAWLFAVMSTIISFFLYMTYRKIDYVADKVQELVIADAVRNERDKGQENRILSIEKWMAEHEKRLNELEIKILK